MSLLDAKPIYKPFHYPWANDACLMQQRVFFTSWYFAGRSPA